MAAPTLALPAAGVTTPRRVLTLAVLLVDIGLLMMFAGLVGAFVHVRHFGPGFPPPGVKIDRYLGNLIVITLMMGSFTTEWAAAAIRKGERRQATTGLGITLGLGLAVLNLISWGAGRAGFTAVSNPYGTLVTALVMTLGIVVGSAVAFVTATLFRVAGGQVSFAEPEQAGAAAWHWHFTVVASVVVWYTVVVLR